MEDKMYIGKVPPYEDIIKLYEERQGRKDKFSRSIVEMTMNDLQEHYMDELLDKNPELLI